MPHPNFYQYIRNRLDYIQGDAKTTVTFQFIIDTAIQNDYGFPDKNTLEIETDVIGSPVRHDDSLEGSGIDESADFRLIVHRLVSGGIDYIDNEFFSRINPTNIRVIVGNRIYQVKSKRAHTDMQNNTPYWVVELNRWMDVDV